MKAAALLFMILSCLTVPFYVTGKKAAIKSLIFLGQKAKPSAFPYTVVLMKDGKRHCTASLISNEFVLTAAHCILYKNITAILGIHDLENYSKKDCVTFNISAKSHIIHEEYTTAAFKNDIGLIKLPSKINFTKSIQPVKLARRNQHELVNKTTTITGWGWSFPQSNILHFGHAVIIDEEICKDIFKEYRSSLNLCLDGKRQKACPGDSGGPAVIKEKDGTSRQVGIASYSQLCLTNAPVVYVRITSYLDWIHNHTGITIEN